MIDLPAFLQSSSKAAADVIDRTAKGEVVMTADSQDGHDLSPAESILKYDIRTVLCAPLLTDGKLTGVIYADTKGKSTFLDVERRAYFLSFVDFISDVILKVQNIREKDDELIYLKKRLAGKTVFPGIIGRSFRTQETTGPHGP